MNRMTSIVIMSMLFVVFTCAERRLSAQNRDQEIKNTIEEIIKSSELNQLNNGLEQSSSEANVGESDVSRDKRITDTVDRILSQPEYRRLTREKEESTQQQPNTRSPARRQRPPPQSSRPPGAPLLDVSAFLFIIVIVILAVILVAIGIAIAKASPEINPNVAAPVAAGGVVIPVTPPGELSTNEYERRALECAREQDFRGALRELILGSMSWIERSGRIRFRRGLTNRDYIRAIWRLQDRRTSMATIVRAFELVYYGHHEADRSMFKECLKEFRESFAIEEDVHATLAK